MAGQNESVTTFTTDHAGVQRSYTTRVYNTSTGAARYTSTYTNSIRNGESYQDKGQSVYTTGPEASQHPDGSTTRNFNVNGELVEFHDANTAGNDRFFANNQHGQALTVVQGEVSDVSAAFIEGLARSSNDARAQHFFFANGQAVGSFGQLTDENDAFEANFEVNYTPVSSRYPGAVPGMVVAQAGDTLRTVAGRVWGDAGLWYLLAEENGLTDADAVLESGTQLKVPNRVVSLAHTSWSFKPFDVSQAIGDTTPTQPAPPPPKKGGGCGVVGQVLVVVVAIVVTVYTAGAASGLAASLGGNFAAGAAVLGGSAVASGTIGLGAALGAAALGGVVGSAVSQGVAMAAGIQDQFDWKGVALAGVGAGVTAGLGASGLNSTLTRSFSGLNKAAPYAVTGVTAATASALTQGIAVATGLQSAFNWRDVAISAVSAPVAQAVGGGAGRAYGNSSVGAIAAQTVAGASGALVRRAFGGTVDVANALIDAFGNALGNSIVDRMGPTAGAAGASSQANRGGSSGTSSSTIDQLEEVQITARRLDNNPTNTIRAGSEVPPDDLALLGSITVEGQRIRQGDDAGLDQWYFLNQYYRPHLTPQGQALVDDAGYAAEDNYRMLQRYGRYNVGALSTVSNTYDLLAGTSTGTGAANLAFGYNGGPASLAEKIIGTPIGLASGGLEGLFRGTAGAGNLRAMLLGPHSTK